MTRSRRPIASSPGATTPTRTRATPRPRSASRRSRRPTGCSRTRTSARHTTRAAASSAEAASTPGRSAAGPAAFGGGIGDILSDLFGGAAGRGGPGVAARRARPRPGDRGARVLRAGSGGRPGVGERAAGRSLPHLPRDRRQARHHAPGVPQLPGPWRRGRVAGPVLDLTALPRVRRHRHRDHRPMPDLQRRRSDQAGQALQGQRAGRGARGQPRAARRQGRARTSRRPAGRPLRGHPGGGARRCSSAAARTSRWRCR